MAGTRTAASGNATYTFTWTATAARIDAIADGAARKIWINQNPDKPITEYDALTVQQKINVLDAWISRGITAMATLNKVETDGSAAELAAQQYATANYGL